MKCPCCDHEWEIPKLTTLVTAAHEPFKGEPDAFCTFPLYRNNDPKQHYPCWKPAVIVDALFPVYWDSNRCAEHLNPENPIVFNI